MHTTRTLLALALGAALLLPACASAGSGGGHDVPDLLATSRDADALVAALRAANAEFANEPSEAILRDRAALAASQSPPVAVLACADSRVAPEWVFEQTPGRLFVVRDAGNVADVHAIASFEYAVAHLDTRLIVVLGHSSCGAVKAAAAGGDPGSPALRDLVEVIAPAVAEAHQAGGDLVKTAIEVNVRRSVHALTAHSDILATAVREGRLRIVGGVHDLATGKVRFLD